MEASSDTKSITDSNLEEIYYNNKNKDAAKKLGVCVDTLVSMVKEAGIKPKGKSFRKKYNIIKED